MSEETTIHLSAELPEAATAEEQGSHVLELKRLGLFATALLGLVAVSYALPQLREVQPWLPGEPVPLVRLFEGGKVVKENAQGEVVVQQLFDEPTPEPSPEPGSSEQPVVPVPVLPDRSPAKGAFLDAPQGALDTWFTELARAEAGEPGVVVRALHWGDSTIAGDGITSTIRERLQGRFGDGGPGFLSVQVDPRWALRPSVSRVAKGDWETLTIIFGGAETARYGLAGTVSTATGESTSYLANRKVDGVRAPVHRFQVFYQAQPGGGSFTAKPRGARGTGRSTEAAAVSDRFVDLEVPEGSESLWIATGGDGPVSIYGAALETAGPGLTWETFGVAGAGQGSMLRQGRSHLAGQVAAREPHLLVYMTGGNELSYPSLDGDGTKYQESFARVLERLKAGAPEASCLVISPLDQGTRSRGQIVSKENLPKMVALQRATAHDQGCAFWDAWGAMGGEGSFARWLAHEPPLAWTDLMHLSDEGLELIGHSFADAVELSYESWRQEHPELPAPGSLVPPPEPEPVEASDPVPPKESP